MVGDQEQATVGGKLEEDRFQVSLRYELMENIVTRSLT